MKRGIFTLIGIFLMYLGYSQTIVFQEDFEGSTISMTSSSKSGLNNWVVTNHLSSQGLKADSATVGLNDSIFLTSPTFSCSGMSFVILEFDQIAKVQILDAAALQYSVDNGATWQTINTGYMGNGIYQTPFGFRFNANSYTTWLANDNNAIPDSSWWKHETFNLSTLVANQSQVKIRFILADGVGTGGSSGNYGWLLDDIKVTASFSELIPPTISLIAPYPVDTAYTSGPFEVKVKATDASGIDTVVLHYWTSDGFADTLGMSLVSADTFAVNIPFHGFGRTISYYTKAYDASAAANADSTSTKAFFCKNAPGGTGVIGTGTTTVGHPFYTFYMDSRTQMLYTASEINAAGVFAGNIISIGFDVASAAPQVMNGFTIKMKTTAATTLSSFDNGTGWTTVFTGNHSITTTGWNTFTLSSPFVWDGSSNLMIDICFDNSSFTSNTTVNSSAATGMTWHQHSDLSAGNLCTSTSGTVQTDRPNLQLTVQSASSIRQRPWSSDDYISNRRRNC